MSIKSSPLKERSLPSSLPSAALTSPLALKKVLILVESIGGLGDLTFAIKTAEVFQKHPSIECAILCNKDLDIDSITKVAGKALSIRVYSEETIPKSFAANIDAYFGAATCTKLDSLCFLSAFEIDIRKPYIGLSEYNVFPRKTLYENKDDREYVLGFGENCLGLYLNEDLKIYFHSGEGQDKLRRLSHLAHLLAPLKEALLEGSTIEVYSQTKVFYMGYSYYLNSAIQFLALVAQKEKGSSHQTIDVLIPGLKRNAAGDKKALFESMKDVKQFIPKHFISCGFSEIRCHGHVIQLSEQPGKILNIHNPQTLEKGDFLQSMLASEPLMLVTGDQSLSEALSAGKMVMYEQLAHKEELLRDFTIEAEKFNLGAPLSSLAYKELEENKISRFSSLLKVIECESFGINYSQFIRHLHKTHDASHKVLQIAFNALKLS